MANEIIWSYCTWKILLLLLLSAINKLPESKPPRGLRKAFVDGANHCLYTCLSIGGWKPLAQTLWASPNWISWPLFLDKQQINLTGSADESRRVVSKCLRQFFLLTCRSSSLSLFNWTSAGEKGGVMIKQEKTVYFFKEPLMHHKYNVWAVWWSYSSCNSLIINAKLILIV